MVLRAIDYSETTNLCNPVMEIFLTFRKEVVLKSERNQQACIVTNVTFAVATGVTEPNEFAQRISIVVVHQV